MNYQCITHWYGSEGDSITRRRDEEGVTQQLKRAGCEKSRPSWALFRKGPPLSRCVLLSSCPAITILLEPLSPPSHTYRAPPPTAACPRLPSMCCSRAHSLDPRPQHMEDRPRGLLCNGLHSWGSAGVDGQVLCGHMVRLPSHKTPGGGMESGL